MKKLFFLFSLFLVFVSCSKIKSEKHRCIYLFDELVFNDTNRLIMEKSHTPNFQDLLERDDSSKEKSLYQFDSNRRLRFYAFLYNDSDYSFSIKYDSLGNIIKKTGGDVVKWVAEKQGTDSLHVAFLLYSIGISYGKINMTVNNDTFKNITLFKSRIFSNLVGGTIRAPSRDIIGKNIKITGLKRINCTSVYAHFNDSVIIE